MRLTILSNAGEVADVADFEIRKLEDARTRVGPQRLSLWDRVGASWRESRRRMFETAGVSAGTPWVSYDQTEEGDWYRWWKAIVYGNDATITVMDVLRWRGSDILMRSFVEPTHPDYVQREQAGTVEIGSKLRYAINHDRGIGRAPEQMGGHPIPRRTLTGIGADLRRSIREDLIRYAADFGTQLGDKLDRASARALPLAR